MAIATVETIEAPPYEAVLATERWLVKPQNRTTLATCSLVKAYLGKNNGHQRSFALMIFQEFRDRLLRQACCLPSKNYQKALTDI